MIYLDSLIDSINAEIKSGLSDVSQCINGLVRKALRGDETVLYDVKENQVMFDTLKDIYVYHRQINSDYETIQGPGKKNKYRITARMELVCYSKFRNSQDYIVDKLANLKDIEVTGSENDSQKIFEEETGQKGFDIKHYVFKINYDLKYSSDRCNTCLKNCK